MTTPQQSAMMPQNVAVACIGPPYLRLFIHAKEQRVNFPFLAAFTAFLVCHSSAWRCLPGTGPFQVELSKPKFALGGLVNLPAKDGAQLLRRHGRRHGVQRSGVKAQGWVGEGKEHKKEPQRPTAIELKILQSRSRRSTSTHLKAIANAQDRELSVLDFLPNLRRHVGGAFLVHTEWAATEDYTLQIGLGSNEVALGNAGVEFAVHIVL